SSTLTICIMEGNIISPLSISRIYIRALRVIATPSFRYNLSWLFNIIMCSNSCNFYILLNLPSCTSFERSLNYATKMVRMLQSSTCEEQRSVVRFCGPKGINPVKFTGTCNVRGIEAAILNDRRVQLRALSQKFNISYVGDYVESEGDRRCFAASPASISARLSLSPKNPPTCLVEAQIRALAQEPSPPPIACRTRRKAKKGSTQPAVNEEFSKTELAAFICEVTPLETRRTIPFSERAQKLQIAVRSVNDPGRTSKSRIRGLKVANMTSGRTKKPLPMFTAVLLDGPTACEVTKIKRLYYYK
ncbi:hypothetical protein L9F63_004360, partial [Diploptera punctata]